MIDRVWAPLVRTSAGRIRFSLDLYHQRHAQNTTHIMALSGIDQAIPLAREAGVDKIKNNSGASPFFSGDSMVFFKYGLRKPRIELR
jgi:hypothetical protein